MLNADILPKLNYVSMSLNDHSTTDSRSPADMTSVVSAVNAAAIKYLDDQQLVQQAVAAANKGRNSSSQSAHRSGKAAMSSSNASIYGVKSANLSLASKKYFEKHRLGANRAHPAVTELQSAVSKSRMEDLLNSITSQVNGMQMTMSLDQSPQRNVTVDDSGRHFNNSLSFNRRQSDHSSVSSVGNESSQSLPMRQHTRKSFDGSAVSNTLLDETWSSEWHHASHLRSSLDSSKQHRRHHGVPLHHTD